MTVPRTTPPPSLETFASAISTFAGIRFREEDHTYLFEDQSRGTSVTTWLKSYDDFDQEKVAARVAEREGRTVGSVILEWETKAKKASEHGTQVHKYMEDSLECREPIHAFGREITGDLEVFLQEMREFGVASLKTEWIVGWKPWKICGTIDLLVWNPHTKSVEIWDWKTNEKFDTDSKWFFDFAGQKLPKSKLHKYSLQLSIYKAILRKAGLEVGKMRLVHIPSTEGPIKTHTAIDYSHLVETVLTNCS